MPLLQVSPGQEMYHPLALAIDNAGVLHVAWRGIDGALYYRQRPKRWRPPQLVAGPDNAHAAFEMNNGEVVALVWAHRGGRYDVWRAEWNGSGFGEPTLWIPDAKMPQPVGDKLYFARAMDQTGFVWQRDSAGALEPIHEGAFPRAALAPNGRVNVVWFSNAPGNAVVLNGRTVVEGLVQQHPHLAVDSAGAVHLVWARGQDFTIWYQRRFKAKTLLQLGAEFIALRFPRIAVDAHDNLHVVFQAKEQFLDQAQERWKIYHLVRSENVWSAPRRVSTSDEGEYQFPNLAIRDNTLAIGFWDSANKAYTVEWSELT